MNAIASKGPLTTFRLAGLFAKRQDGDRMLTWLPVASFAIVTALLLVVLGGARALMALGMQQEGMYQMLTSLALSLLVVPMITLGAAAAKLAARRRDARLSSLRLLGATSKQVAGCSRCWPWSAVRPCLGFSYRCH